MLKEEFKYYLENQKELVKLYQGKFLVIKDKSVVGVYENEFDAIDESLGKYEPGTFLVQECLPGDENYTQTFHSRVIFA
ncbi:MAG: hypothetical protein CVU09_00465 [Bacteroidetes bacterium HGW-Bacteroidetes-4]|jgi:hypothetical protein|nr:MAG: hypothetical protein CVU09_00465 [Bacteroidetes bacterium HGW-Bacteroidetes-4]